MPILLSSYVSAPLNSVMICRNIIAATLNMLFRAELSALGAWTDWLGPCWLCLPGGGTQFSYSGRAGLCNSGQLRLLLLLCCTPAKGSPGVVWLEKNTITIVVLGALCNFLLCISCLLCLQPQQLEEWPSSSSTNFQLQHVGIHAVLPFSKHSLHRW
jgi:small-conductance mechanosensitive channel